MTRIRTGPYFRSSSPIIYKKNFFLGYPKIFPLASDGYKEVALFSSLQLELMSACNMDSLFSLTTREVQQIHPSCLSELKTIPVSFFFPLLPALIKSTSRRRYTVSSAYSPLLLVPWYWPTWTLLVMALCFLSTYCALTSPDVLLNCVVCSPCSEGVRSYCTPKKRHCVRRKPQPASADWLSGSFTSMWNFTLFPGCSSFIVASN